MFANRFGIHENVECGLVYIIHPPVNTNYWHQETVKTCPIPLESVSIQASVVHTVAQVEITQVYVNKEYQPIEAIYYFPVDSNGGVTHFQAELEGRTIKGVVKPEEEAKAQYDKAIQEKKSAFLVESNKPDIFKVRIGFLKPGSQVKVIIGYVTEVKNEQGTNGLRFFIPTTVSPRYIPSTETDKKSMDLQNMKFSSRTTAPLVINVNVAMQGKIKSIESPTHKINVSQSSIPGKKSWTRVIVNLTGRVTDMDRDFVLSIIPEEKHVPRLYQEKSNDSTALMAHLIPSFNLDEQKVELIFVLDRSGSMHGSSIELAKNALKLFLHSLPIDCYFNVVGFGSSYQFLFPKSTKYSNASFTKALCLAQNLAADMGGTEILQPLKEIFYQKLITGYLRQVFVITDGEVSNTEQVIGLVKAHAHISRVFALGIGDGASHDLVEGVAAAGGGTAVFATYNETIDSKVLQQLKNAIQPSLTNVRVTWKGLPELERAPPVEIQKEKTLLGYGKPINSESATATSIAPKYIQVPENVPPIFDGSQLLVFGIFPDEVPSEVCITADSPDGPLSVSIQLDDNGENMLGEGTEMIHKLAAIKSVAELQLKLIRNSCSSSSFWQEADSSNLKSQIIEISCKNGTNSILSPQCAQQQQLRSLSNSNGFQFQVNQGPHFVSLKKNSMKKSSCLSSSPWPPTHFSSSTAVNFGQCQQQQATPFDLSQSNQMSHCFGATIGSGQPQSFSHQGSFSAPNGHHQNQQQLNNIRFGFNPSNQQQPNDVVSTQNDFLLRIISLQSFDGSFSLNENFSKVLSLDLEVLKKDAQANGWDDKSYATALALSYFSEKLGNLKESWELVALKAKKWLQENSATNYEAIITAATAYVQSI